MKKTALCILMTSALFFGYPVTNTFAGPGHDGHSHSHDISSDDAKKKARDIVAKLVEKKKVAASWQNVDAQNVEKKRFGKKDEWVVSFHNAKESNSTKQTLYIFLSMEGKYIAANFTGQ